MKIFKAIFLFALFSLMSLSLSAQVKSNDFASCTINDCIICKNIVIKKDKNIQFIHTPLRNMRVGIGRISSDTVKKAQKKLQVKESKSSIVICLEKNGKTIIKDGDCRKSVSYTHLTLPTICSV